MRSAFEPGLLGGPTFGHAAAAEPSRTRDDGRESCPTQAALAFDLPVREEIYDLGKAAFPMILTPPPTFSIVRSGGRMTAKLGRQSWPARERGLITA